LAKKAKAYPGKVRINHGLNLQISGVLSPGYQHLNSFELGFQRRQHKIDLIGPWDAGLNTGMRALATTFLPLKARVHVSKLNNKDLKVSLTLGAKKLSIRRVKALLEDLISKGDPLFLVEITYYSDARQVR